MTVTVEGVNDLADADETATVSEDSGVTVLANVLANTSDPEAGDPTVVAVSAASNGGIFTINPDGTATFDTNGDFEALATGETTTTSVTYTVEDAAGDQVTSTVTVTVEGVAKPHGTITGSVFCDKNHNAIDDTGDTPVVQKVVMLLHPDGTAVETVDGAPILTSTLSDGTYSFANVPVGDYRVGFLIEGTMQFVTQGLDLDGDGRSDDPNASDVDDSIPPISVLLGSLSIDVQPTDVFNVGPEEVVSDVDAGLFVPNVAPDAKDDAATTTESSSVALDLSADNGNGADTDADGDVLRLVSIGQTEQIDLVPTTAPDGSVDYNATLLVESEAGRTGLVFVSDTGGPLNFEFSPDGGFDDLALGETDIVSLSYRVSDGNGATDTAVVTVTVEGEEGATVGASISMYGNGDRNIAIILDTSYSSVGMSAGFSVPDYDNDGNLGTPMDQMLSKVIALASTLAETDLISLIPSGYNGFIPDNATAVTLTAGELDAAAGDLTALESIFSPITSTYNLADYATDFVQAFNTADEIFQTSEGFEQNKIIAMIASDPMFVDQMGDPVFLGGDVVGAFDEVTQGPSNADVDLLVIDDTFVVADRLFVIDSDSMVDVDVTRGFGLDTLIDTTPTVISAADVIGFRLSVDGVQQDDVDIADLTPTADGFSFTSVLLPPGIVEAAIDLDIDGDGAADLTRTVSQSVADGEVVNLLVDGFVSDRSPESGPTEITGTTADDVIFGTGGADILDGGMGNDTLTGNSGADLFVFRSGDGPTFIADYELGMVDSLDLEGFSDLMCSTDPNTNLLSLANQVGDNVEFDFGDNDVLTLLQINLELLTTQDLCVR